MKPIPTLFHFNRAAAGIAVLFTRTRTLLLLGLVITATHCLRAEPAAPSTPPAATTTSTHPLYLFSFFRDNGQDGLFLARSRDGFVWDELKPPGKSFLQPQLGPHKLMRDPCLRLGPDGVFHLVWTTGWGDRIFGYAHSRDLLQWSEQRAVPAMEHEPSALNTWAPELFHDAKSQTWWIFWASTIPGRFPQTEGQGDDRYNHRMYATTTKDFQSFTPTRLFYDGGFNVIDATLIEHNGLYWLIVKDETKTPVRKQLRVASAEQPGGPFSAAGLPITGSWVEGPTAVEVGDWVHIYYDHYTEPQHYGGLRTPDFFTWASITGQLKFPAGARHGTVIRLTDPSLVNRLLAAPVR